jgi:hypothetical protein
MGVLAKQGPTEWKYLSLGFAKILPKSAKGIGKKR